jgi:hypothetical protein
MKFTLLPLPTLLSFLSLLMVLPLLSLQFKLSLLTVCSLTLVEPLTAHTLLAYGVHLTLLAVNTLLTHCAPFAFLALLFAHALLTHCAPIGLHALDKLLILPPHLIVPLLLPLLPHLFFVVSLLVSETGFFQFEESERNSKHTPS